MAYSPLIEIPFPPGHFYSPYADLADIQARRDVVFDRTVDPLGVDLREQRQHELLAELAAYYPDIAYGENQAEHLRYSFDNGMLGYADGTLLYLLLRHVKPRRLIEVGSGWSSALILDTVEAFDLDTELTFIEPHTERLDTLLTSKDRDRATIIAQPVQAVDLTIFDTLQDGDILFIDSTHVSKVGSDVNLLFFEVLPRLASGVHIHVHDIFFPFEYPEKWIAQGRAWSESYVLRAFLQFNQSFEVTLFANMMQLRHRDWLDANLPLTLKNPAGSFWMRRTS